MIDSDKRKFPRESIKSQQRILSLNLHDEFSKDFVVSRNISASGFCFRSRVSYEKGHIFLVHLDDSLLRDIKDNLARVMKSGKYVLAKVVWVSSSSVKNDPFFEVGCEFVSIQESNISSVEIFTRLMNFYTAESISGFKINSNQN